MSWLSEFQWLGCHFSTCVLFKLLLRHKIRHTSPMQQMASYFHCCKLLTLSNRCHITLARFCIANSFRFSEVYSTYLLIALSLWTSDLLICQSACFFLSPIMRDYKAPDAEKAEPHARIQKVLSEGVQLWHFFLVRWEEEGSKYHYNSEPSMARQWNAI